MIMGHYVKVSDLPRSIQRALESAGYNRKDIEVRVEEKFEPRPPSAQGRKGFCAACRLDDTDEFQIRWGSFGGSNMFTKTIDDVDAIWTIPDFVAFVTGLSNAGPGYPGFATIHVSPKNVVPSLMAPTSQVSEREAKILCIFKSLKSSARKEYLSRMKATDAEVNVLVERGYLSRNAAGATSITTEGRNAAGKEYY